MPLSMYCESSMYLLKYHTCMHSNRFWRDIFVGCISVFYHLFYYLEDNLLLDSTSPIDLFCLHVVYQPYINHCIGVFVDAWNNHPLTTEGNKSPSQLWIQGLLLNSRSGHTVTEELYCDAHSTNVSLNIKFVISNKINYYRILV